MSMQAGLEIFERAADVRGRLLRAEGDRTGATQGVLTLTFDIGRILVTPGDAGLLVEQLADPTSRPRGLEALDEEEPWWRLLGHPLTAAWPGGVEDGVGASGLGSLMVLKLRFREDTASPRVLVLEATGKAIRVRLEDT